MIGSRRAIDPERFCYYPFTQLLLQPTGAVSPCCWNQKYVLGHIPQNSIAEIWNGDAMRKLRREFLDGNPVTCQQQIEHIKCHKWSMRDDSSLTEVLASGPSRLDLRLNGRCNLRCVMCGVWRQPNGIYDRSEFWTIGREKIFPFLKEVDVLGGEPFVQSDTFRLIDLVAQINPMCTWAFVTNGSYKFGPLLQRRLDKIRLRWIQISVDSVHPATYAKIRLEGDLAKTLATLQAYQEYRAVRLQNGEHFRVIASMCVQQLNWQEIGDFLDFGCKSNIETVLQFAYEPPKQSLLSLSHRERLTIIENLSVLSARFGPEMLNPVALPLIDSVRESGNGSTL